MASAVVGTLSLSSPAASQTLADAMIEAYLNNPGLNAARASLRATDEGVPQALAGYRPVVSGSADVGVTYTHSSGTTYPRGMSITIEQPLFLGFRTTNGLKMAETAVLAGREGLRTVEQDTFLATVTAFMNLVQAQAILNIRGQNLEFLREQVRAAQDRLNVGEGTRTDVAQTNAALAAGQAQYNAAAATLNAAIATYQQVVGMKPTRLGSARTVEPMLPRSQNAAIAAGLGGHPAILAAAYNIDIAAFNVKVLEGAMLPTVTAEGSLSHRLDNQGSGSSSKSASLVARLSVPIYEGGAPSSRVRQAKETLGQRRIEHDAAIDQVRAAVIIAWGSLDAARAQIIAAEAQVAATQLVLSGVIEERKVGQRTTLDVLDAQSDLLDARVLLVTAQRDRVVAAYTLLAAVGMLKVEKLGLNVARYDATHHYGQVRDKWHGVRTPDGR